MSNKKKDALTDLVQEVSISDNDSSESLADDQSITSSGDIVTLGM